MTTSTLDVEPACPGQDVPGTSDTTVPGREPADSPDALRVERRSIDAVDPATWDALAHRTPWATCFSMWGFHRAWWDGYGENVHEDTLVVVDPTAAADAPPVAIVPLMHRHEVEATDRLTRTAIRAESTVELTPVEPHAKAIFMGASYHADYATLLAAPEDVPAVAEALVAYLAEPPASGDPHPMPWDVVDLRRLRCGDPAVDALCAAFEAHEGLAGWDFDIEREDVCPVLTLPDGADFDGYLATLGKKERHEVRRKLRRAEAAGEVRLEESTDPVADLEAFVDLHQRRWGEDGLFPDTHGGEQSRVFFRRLFELLAPDHSLRLGFLSVGGRRIAAGVYFDDGETLCYYNAGIDPEARELSPGVLLVAKSVERALELGRRRLDFLRGDEPYKYEWGATDQPIQRLLVHRTSR